MGALTERENPVLDEKGHKTPLTDRKMNYIAHGRIRCVSKSLSPQSSWLTVGSQGKSSLFVISIQMIDRTDGFQILSLMSVDKG